jgi:hypothetical protein
MAREKREAKETGRMLLCDVALSCIKELCQAFYPAGSNVHFSYRLLLLCGASRQFIFLNEIPLNCLPGEQNPPQIGFNLLWLHSAELTFSTNFCVEQYQKRI